MPYNNSDLLTNKEFFAIVARLLNVSTKTVQKYWEDGFYEAIVRQLYLTRNCRLPHLGTFGLRYMPEGESQQTTPDGKKVTYKIPERDIPIFTPHDDFINDVNCMGVTKKYRKRANNGKLTYHDYKRQKRAEEFGTFGSSANLTPDRIEKSKEDFKDYLDKIKEEKENNEKT